MMDLTILALDLFLKIFLKPGPDRCDRYKLTTTPALQGYSYPNDDISFKFSSDSRSLYMHKITIAYLKIVGGSSVILSLEDPPYSDPGYA